MFPIAKNYIQNSKAAIEQVFFSKKFFSLWWGYAGVFCLNILAFPLLTRIYPPQAFGELALFSNTIIVLSSVGAANLEKAIILAKSRLRAINLGYMAVGVLAAFSIITGVSLFFLFKPLSKSLGITSELSFYWLLLPLVVFSAGIYQIASAALLRKEAFQELSLNRLLLRTSTLSIQAGLVLILGSRFGLIIGFIAGFMLIFLICFYRFLNLKHSYHLSVAYCKQSWQRFSDIPCYSFPQSLFLHISSKTPFLMVAYFFSVEEVGYFSVAYGILSLPEALIAAALGDIFFQKASSSNGLNSIKILLSQYWIGLLLLGCIPFGILFLNGESIVIIIMGETWRTTGKMISVMAPMFLFTFISTPTSSTLTVLRRQKWSLVFGIISFLVRPLVFYSGYMAGDIIFAIALWGLYEITQLIIYNGMIYYMVSPNDSADLKKKPLKNLLKKYNRIISKFALVE